MMPAIEKETRNRAEELAANHPDWSALAIQRRLKFENRKASPRTVSRWLTEFRGRTEEEKFEYKVFSWPESMEKGFLPWEAARSLLDLLERLLHTYKGTAEAAIYTLPTNLEARWFWRVTQAAPDAPIDTRANIARFLTQAERFQPPEAANAIFEEFRWRLVYQPWKSDEHTRQYESAQKSKKIPVSRWAVGGQKRRTKQKGR